MAPGARSHVLTLASVMSLALAGLAMRVSPVVAGGGDTFIVRSTGNGADVNLGDDVCDADPVLRHVRCTLRAAIEEANFDADEDRIEFRIGGRHATGVKVISVPDPGLPAITRPLIIDGYTQPDSRPNTAAHGTNAVLRIVLDGPGAESNVSGLATPEVNAPAIEVRGLVIRDFYDGIQVWGSYSVIAGNFLGTNASGSAARPNGWGIQVYGADHTRIGGSRRADRNLLSGNVTDGIYVGSGDWVRIMGNLIGVTASGGGDLGSDIGIEIFTRFSTHGVVIGGGTAEKANVIAHAVTNGITIRDSGDGANISVRVLRNSIYANGELAIDIDGDGVTANDGFPDGDTGSNGLQNFPEIRSARTESGVTRIRGTLTTAPERSYRLEFFSNPGGTDEARKYIGAKTVTTDVNGFVRWVFRPATKVPLGRAVTATATDLTARQTSEVSAPRTVVAP